jgi:hypothetical protein
MSSKSVTDDKYEIFDKIKKKRHSGRRGSKKRDKLFETQDNFFYQSTDLKLPDNEEIIINEQAIINEDNKNSEEKLNDDVKSGNNVLNFSHYNLVITIIVNLVISFIIHGLFSM